MICTGRTRKVRVSLSNRGGDSVVSTDEGVVGVDGERSDRALPLPFADAVEAERERERAHKFHRAVKHDETVSRRVHLQQQMDPTRSALDG